MQTQTTSITSLPATQTFGNPALDFACDQLHDGDIAQTLDELFEDLGTRRTDDACTWREYADECLNHPLRDLLHQDPFTHRAFAKPRGYAGDAVMMDYIYGLGEARDAAEHATSLGRAIFTYMSSRPSAKAVRYRRQLIAKMIDQVASRGQARVLAIAAGHLREVELSAAVQQGQVAEFIAIDQDPASLAVVARDYTRLGVRTIEGSVRQILAGKVNLGQFDFVYAAGLFDYLSAPVAAALSRRMFEMTKPGGVMLIPNFLGTVRDRGYMESFMDWRLIYRNHADMQALADALPEDSVAEHRIFDDEDDAITFLVVSKTAATSGSLCHEPQRHGNEEMPLPFETGAHAEQTDIDVDAIDEVVTRAPRRAVADLRDGRPAIGAAARARDGPPAAPRLVNVATCGYNWCVQTGIRELKDNLSRYIRRLEAGERITVTAHGRVVAELVPPSAAKAGRPSRYDELVASGDIRLAVEPGDPLEGWPGLRLPAGTAAGLIDEDREER